MEAPQNIERNAVCQIISQKTGKPHNERIGLSADPVFLFSYSLCGEEYIFTNDRVTGPANIKEMALLLAAMNAELWLSTSSGAKVQNLPWISIVPKIKQAEMESPQ
jgi:hypothetical protein